MVSRIAVDVGGTFTDLVYYDDRTAGMRVTKVPTTPASPERGAMAAVAEALSETEIRQAGYFLHGTTVGLNSLLQRVGARVGLLCTAGFRDILEIRRGDRDEMYNLFWSPDPPLVPRRLRRRSGSGCGPTDPFIGACASTTCARPSKSSGKKVSTRLQLRS